MSRHVLLVPQGAGVVRWRFEAGGTDLTVRLQDAAGKAIEGFTVALEGTPACDQRAARYFVASEVGRGAVLPLVAAGQWRVAVNGTNLIVAPRDLTLDDAVPRQELTFVAEPAATVTLVLRTRDGSTFSPPLSLLPPLRAAGREVKCVAPSVRAYAGLARGDTCVDYPNVPLGPAELRFEDGARGDEQLMLPFEPLPPVTLDVIAGGANELVLTVEPRVPVDLRGCDQRGMEDLHSIVTVLADGRSVRGQDAIPSQRWRGWLPRGTYCVVVERSTGVPFPAAAGSRREHSLRVDREPVRQRFRP